MTILSSGNSNLNLDESLLLAGAHREVACEWIVEQR